MDLGGVEGQMGWRHGWRWVRYPVRWSLGWSFDRIEGRTAAHKVWKCGQDSV